MRARATAVGRRPLAVVAVLVLLSASCTDDTGPGERAENPSDPAAPTWLVERSAGNATTFEISDRSFDLPAPGLGPDAAERFAAGDTAFQTRFDSGTGLGPDFNADGCNACHVNNGRQRAPIGNGYVGIGPVVHVSTPGAGEGEAPFALPGYGTRLQTYATAGDAEAQINVLWETLEASYPDGTPIELRRPVVSIVGREGMLPVDAQISLRIPPQVAGPGLLDLVPEADIVAAADPDDADGDGISGEVQWVPVTDGTVQVGRHGWKAENVDLLHQSASALAEDIGVGTALTPIDGEIEFGDDELAALAFYIEALALPAGRDVDDPTVARGAAMFDSVGCASCHTPQLRTGSDGTPELADLVIHPFTDLLLHDLGAGLADDRPVYGASGTEWRTAPLWGIGLLDMVNGHVSLLHDGRARSIEEAILWHGGEAQAVTDAFMALDAADRAALIRFVESR